MYELEYLPVAQQDMIEIVRYISQNLKNPAAAEQLATDFIEAGNNIAAFPYASPSHIPIRPLKHEYRKRSVQNYLMLYWIDEKEQRITVARVIYAKREYSLLLK